MIGEPVNLARMPALLLIAAVAWAGAGCGSDSPNTPGTGPAAAARPESSGGSAGVPADRDGSGNGPAKRTDGGNTSGGSHGGAAASAGHPEAPSEDSHFTPPRHHDSGGGAAQYKIKGADNSIQESGTEASSAEFDEAAAALHAYLDARAAGAWSVACDNLARGVVGQLAALGGEGGDAHSCAEILAGLTAGVSPGALREATVADVGSLRVDGDSGFLLYRGAHGTTWFVPMAREDGSWKVAALAASAVQ